MCGHGQVPAPVDAGEALAMAHAAFDYLNQLDAADLATQAKAECLTGLAQLAAKHAAAQAKLVSAFSAERGHEADGQYSPRTWLRVFTRVTSGAAGAAVAAARQLAGHPVIAGALAEGVLSVSWARRLCEWTARLPGGAPTCPRWRSSPPKSTGASARPTVITPLTWARTGMCGWR